MRPSASAVAPASPEEARARVEELFAAARTRDCPATMALLPGLTSADECARMFEHWSRHGMELVQVLDARLDGRDHRAVIVRCRLREGGREREALVRAEARPGGQWALTL